MFSLNIFKKYTLIQIMNFAHFYIGVISKAQLTAIIGIYTNVGAIIYEHPPIIKVLNHEIRGMGV